MPVKACEDLNENSSLGDLLFNQENSIKQTFIEYYMEQKVHAAL